MRSENDDEWRVVGKYLERKCGNTGRTLVEYNLLERNFYNFDETAICTVQKLGPILEPGGQKRVRAAISGERGQNVTAVCSVCASRNYIPPMLICPRKRMSPQLQNRALYSCFQNWWINEEFVLRVASSFQRICQTFKVRAFINDRNTQ